MPSNTPPSSQSDDPTPVDPQAFIEYSRALHEWTLQKWLQAVRDREERRRLVLLEQEYYASRSLQLQERQPQQSQQTPTTPTTRPQLLRGPSSSKAETPNNDTQSSKDQDNTS